MEISNITERLTVLGVKQNLNGDRAVVYDVCEDGKSIGRGVLIETKDSKIYVEFEEIKTMNVCFVRTLEIERNCKCEKK